MRTDPSFRLRVVLPAVLPHWELHGEPTRAVHVQALRAACEALAPTAEAELDDVGAAASIERESHMTVMRRCLAQMRTSIEFADALWQRDAGPSLCGEVRMHLLEAIGRAYELGQLLAVPMLAERLVAAENDSSARATSLVAIGRGWPVVDRDGNVLGQVVRVHGE